MFFVSNPDSPFYQSKAFGKVIDYMMKYTRRCDLREQNGLQDDVEAQYGVVLPFPGEPVRSGLPDEHGKLPHLCPMSVHELKTDEFAELYADEIKGEGQISGEEFVDECQVESDLELLLPANYVTGSSERMLLYRELDGLTLDKDVEA